MADRRYFRCAECRRCKVKCRPWPRRWDDAVKERCDHCCSKGHHCGPNVNSAGELEPFRNSHHQPLNNRPSTSRNRAWGPPPPLSPSVARGPSPQMSPPASRPGMQIFRAGPQPPATPGHQRPAGSPSRPSWAQIAQRQHQQPFTETVLSEVDALIEIHSWLRQLQRSLYLYRKAGHRHRCTSLDDKENAIANFLCRLQEIFQDRLDNAMAAAVNQVTLPRSDLLRRVQDCLERFLGDLPSAEQKQGVPPRLLQLSMAIAERLIPEYALHDNHIQAYRTRRLSSTTNNRPRPPDRDRLVDDIELEQYMTCYNQVYSKLTEIIQFHLHPSYAVCFMDNRHSSNCLTPGHFALLSQDRSMAHALYASGRWNHNDCDFLRRGAIHLAAELGDLRLLHMIHNRDPGAIRQARPDIYNLSPLCLAAIHGHVEVFKFLIEHGADVAVRDLYKKSALYFAASGGHHDLVSYQINYVSFRAQDPTGFCSPLHAAAAGGHQEVINCLIEAGADPGLVFDGLTAATVAARFKHPKVETKLRQAEKEWNMRHMQRPIRDQIRDAPVQPRTPASGSTTSQATELHEHGSFRGLTQPSSQPTYNPDHAHMTDASSSFNDDAQLSNYESFEESVLDFSDSSFVRSRDGDSHDMYGAN